MASTQDVISEMIEVAFDSAPAAPRRTVVSWAAVIAGAFVAAATSLVLLILGSGFGLALAAPWSGAGPSVVTFTVLAGIWLIVVQWAASAMGGYLTGRLRTRWPGTHPHEVFFRDTAHGFLTWALSTVIVAVLVIASALLAAGVGARGADGVYAYQVDTLFRSDHRDDSPSAAATRAEAARILEHETAKGAAPPQDRLYLGNLVAVRAGLSPADAQQRVDSTISLVRKAADDSRKATSATSIFTGLAMLVGAFIACVAAALGGQQRDEHP